MIIPWLIEPGLYLRGGGGSKSIAEAFRASPAGRGEAGHEHTRARVVGLPVEPEILQAGDARQPPSGQGPRAGQPREVPFAARLAVDDHRRGRPPLEAQLECVLAEPPIEAAHRPPIAMQRDPEWRAPRPIEHG